MFKLIEENKLKYKVGALMYSPASNESVVEKILNRANNLESGFRFLDSLVLCLEDAITFGSVEKAEKTLVKSMRQIWSALNNDETKDLPLLFIRVRNSGQISRLISELGELGELLTGFVLPKYDSGNSNDYAEAMQEINSQRRRTFYCMPTLETLAIGSCETRARELAAIKTSFVDFHKYILNIRIGGNDFCGLFGVRRNPRQSIYDIILVRSILEDVLNVFSHDYIISAPVWEYFGDDKQGAWAKGLERELELDVLNGFIGKTAIHPTQLELIHNALCVDKQDFIDAQNILNWNNDELGVAKSSDGARMNEVATHRRWAERVLTLAEIYGLKR